MKKMSLLDLIKQGLAEFIYSDGIIMVKKEVVEEEAFCDILDDLCDCINLND